MFHYIICHREGPIADGRMPYDLRMHQHASLYHMQKKWINIL